MASLITNNDILMFERQAWHNRGEVFGRLLQYEDIANVELPEVVARPMYTYGADGEANLIVSERIALVATSWALRPPTTASCSTNVFVRLSRRSSPLAWSRASHPS